MKQATLCLLIKNDKVLLAMKMRGFGVGRWNGTGGKVKKGEKIVEAAIRETKEEIGVDIKNLEKVGLFHFTFLNKSEWNQDVTLFLVKDWIGEPAESEEMAPKWFSFDEIPYDKMWSDDIHWMSLVLQGKKLEADFVFGEGDKLLNHNIKIVEET